jgi:hypothetical protein
MQTYSLGLGTSFSTRKSVQPTLTLTKPYASLSSHDTVHFSAKRENNTARRIKYETLCLAVGVTEAEIASLREAAKNTDKVKNADVKQKFDRTNSEHAKLLKAEYLKRLKNESGEYDGAHDSVSESEWK